MNFSFKCTCPDQILKYLNGNKMKNKNIFETAFVKLISENKSIWIMIFLSGVVINIITLFTALYSMQVYDRVLPRQGISTLISLTIGVFLCYLFQWLMLKLRNLLTYDLIRDLDTKVSKILYEHLIDIRADHIPSNKGTLSSQLNGYESIRQFVMTLLSFGLVDAPFAFLYIIFLWYIGGVYIALVPVLIIGILIPYGIFQSYRLERLSKRKFDSFHRKQGFLLETLRNINVIKTAKLNFRMEKTWQDLCSKTQNEELESRTISESTSATVQLFQQLGYVSIVAVGATISATSGDVSAGVILACSILSARVLAPIASIPMLLVQYAQVKATNRFFAYFFGLPRDNDVLKTKVNTSISEWKWRFENFTIQFPGRPPIFEIKKLTISSGAKIGIIGETGCGKTTFLKALSGLFPPSKGKVYLDDIDLQLISRDFLSRESILIPQEPVIFHGSLRDNLKIYNEKLNDDDIISMSRRTGLNSLIQNNSSGLDLAIGEDGAGLSGGQKQLVSLTACLLSGRKVVLLDEPLSSLDPKTEARVLNLFKELYDEKIISTLILITHKMSDLRILDRLIVFQPDGNVLECSVSEMINKMQGKNNG